MTLAYLLVALFLGWLYVVLWRVLLQLRAARVVGCGTPGYARQPGNTKRLAALLRNEDNWVEWIVRGRIVNAVKRDPELRVVLVDGDSVDQTPLIMERMARWYNMGFCRLSDLGGRCAKTGMPLTQGGCARETEPITDCPATCFEVAGLGAKQDGENSTTGAIRCVTYTKGV